MSTYLLVEPVLRHELGRVPLVLVRHRPPPEVAIDHLQVGGVGNVCIYSGVDRHRSRQGGSGDERRDGERFLNGVFTGRGAGGG